MMKKWHVIASAALAIMSIVIIIILTAIWYFRRHLNQKKQKLHLGRYTSQYKYITSSEPPKFVIPPYAVLEDSESTGTADSDHGKTASAQSSPKSNSNLLRSHSTPNVGEGLHSNGGFLTLGKGEQKIRDNLTVDNGLKTKRPHSLNLSPVAKRAKRKTSVAPYGKLQTTVKFMENKNLLVVQVNDTFELPQVRMSGVSTPYVRVHLLPGDKTKQTRSHFMNLACNRICAFDQITIEEAKLSTLKFVVLDYDKFSRSEFLAEMTLHLAEVNLEEGETLKKNLNSKEQVNDDNRGSLLVSLCQAPASGQLTVIIMKAKNLLHNKCEHSSGIDVHVKVSFLVHGRTVDKKKTKIQKRTFSPIFNEAFTFDMKEEDLSHSSIVCEVIGDSVLKSEHIGHVILGLETFGAEVRHWNEMMTSPQKQIAEWHPIKAS